jgi:hypothetical protein
MPRSITRSIKKVPTSQNASRSHPEIRERLERRGFTAHRCRHRLVEATQAPVHASESDLSQAQLRECPQFEVGIACRQCNLECGICQGGRFGRVT